MANQNNNKNGKVEKDPVQANPWRNKLARALLIWAGILFLQSAFFALFNWKPYCYTEGLPTIILIAAIVVGLVALFIIKKRLAWIILITIILILAFDILMPGLSGCRELARRLVCVSSLRGVHIAAALYSNENEDRLPEAGEWGKVAVDCIGGYRVLICPEDKRVRNGEEVLLSSCAMNVEAAGKSWFALPEDMVLFFCAEIEEAKAQQWKKEKPEEIFEVKGQNSGENKKILALYGGPELLSFRHMIHGNIAEVMCISVNGKVYKSRNPAELRWYIDPNKKIPQDISDRMNETYKRHLTRIKNKQLIAKCWIAGWLAGPYVLWLMIFLVQKTITNKRPNC